MAKKSKNNSQRSLLNIVTIVFAGCLIGFLALPYIKYKVGLGSGTYTENVSGFSLIDFDANSSVAIVILLLLIFASILAFVGILKFLCDAKVIKSKSFSKFTTYSAVIFALASFVMTIVAMIVIVSNCSSGKFAFVSAGSYPAWVSLIVSAVIGLGGMATSICSARK